MNKDIFQGKWHEVKGEVLKKWGKLTNDDLKVVEGDSEALFGLLQRHYGLAKQDAERQVKELLRSSH